MKKPRIGISPCIFAADPQRAIFKGKALIYMEQSIGQWLARQGALPYLIPPHLSDAALEDYAADIDGLLLQGGTDVAPEHYGERPLRPEWQGDPVRDKVEIALTKACYGKGVPILGVCRGAQILNVAFGGSLYQDISTQVKGSLVHRDWDIYDQNVHAVQIQPGTRLAQIFSGKSDGLINSVHHQGIKELAPGFRVSATSTADGIIEGIELPDSTSYVLGVQWHPEFQTSQQTDLLDSTAIAADFLQAAAVYSKARNTHD